MIHVNLREQVQRAVQGQWAAFADSHPHLAAVIDQDLLVEQATAALADDPDYQQAMAQATAEGIAVDALLPLVERTVGQWLARLL